ncbi:DNA primase [Salinimicrobium sp. CDJ15-81-2]|nr:DNA primase [Salinimicrobium nanhaiense]
MSKNNSNLSWSSARQICIVKTLANSGHYPTRKSEKEAWFLSPLRSETQASFSVSLTKNLWYDYGLGKGGNIIDLVMAINDCSAYEAVRCLQDNIQFSFCPEKVSRKKNAVQLKRVSVLKHPALIEYLDSRKIPLEVAQRFCQEVWFSLNNKTYFSIGLRNDAGGYELRNKFFKCSTSPKTISSFICGFKRLVITEGMFDFLSLKVLDNELFSFADLVVLNSLGNIGLIPEEWNSYSEIYLLLDNDTAGRTATQQLLKKFSNAIDESQFYFDYKDLNNMLTHGRMER